MDIPERVTLTLGEAEAPITLAFSEKLLETSFVWRPGKQGTRSVNVEGRGIKPLRRQFTVVRAPVPVVRAKDDVYLSMRAVPSPARHTGSSWTTHLRIRLVEAKDSPVLASLKEDLTIELAPKVGTLSVTRLRIPQGRSAPAATPRFETTERDGNRVEIVGLSASIRHDQKLEIPCEELKLDVKPEVRPKALPADGCSTATIRMTLVRHGTDTPVPCPVESASVVLDGTLRPDAYVKPRELSIPKGEWTAVSEAYSYTSGLDQIRVQSHPYQPLRKTLKIQYAFPVWPLVACILAALVGSWLVLVLRMGESWKYIPAAMAVAGLVWLGLRHWLVMTEIIGAVVAPFSVGDSILLGLIAGVAGDLIIAAIRSRFTPAPPQRGAGRMTDS
jgi:hypothetical protein